MKAAEIYEQVTASIVAEIESGLADPREWRAPWHASGFVPTNAATGRAYRGGNVLALASDATRLGYEGPWWATYRQWAGIGRQVRKGERASYGIKWVLPGADKAAPDDGENVLTTGQLRRAFPRGFAVFHHAQTDPVDAEGVVPWEPPAAVAGVDPIVGAEAFFAGVGADVREDLRAYYDPRGDFIGCPPLAAFDAAPAYYATLAHEHVHWTRHASRLDRDGGLAHRFGSDAYAAEELVAELGAAFTCATLGISSEPRPDHAQYLASWLRVLKADPRALFTAAGKAQAAADYLAERATTVAAAA